MLTEHRYVLAVPNLEKSAAFYRDVLGFSIIEIDDPGWLLFERDGVIVMAGECPGDLPPAETGSHSYFAYIIVEDIDAFFEEVTSKGVDLIKPLCTEPWNMREFGLRTVDGHRIMMGQPVSLKS